MNIITTFEIVRTVISGLLLIGLIIAFFQVRAALRVSRANVLLRLMQDWTSNDLYEAIRYIHTLRREWKKIQPNPELWSEIAKKWVEDHANAHSNSDDIAEKQKAIEWQQRRLVSQFLTRMGYFMLERYLSPNDFLGVVPEAPRLLMVLNPIEKSIADFYTSKEDAVEEWDLPFYKYEFEIIMNEYKKWYPRHGKKRIAKDKKS
ncbi:MAG: hypothetical protein KGJ87_04265 [Planctomycetota bacterium]|nr:hypothetical protein [Planctomycetota bacterium]